MMDHHGLFGYYNFFYHIDSYILIKIFQAFINQKYVDVLSTFELQATLTTASVSSSKFNFLTPVSDLTTATTVHLIAKISSSFISVNSSKFANAINSSLPLATTFAINRLANGNYTLQNIASSLYATAEQDFTSTPLVADRPVVKNWEQFFITVNNIIHYQDKNNRN